MDVMDVNGCETGVILNNPVSEKNKRIPMRKNFFFTYNNYTDAEVDVIISTLKKFSFKGKVQSEVGANGTPHLQGMIWCKEQHRSSEFKLSNKIHWEKLKDENNNRNYCAKADTWDGKYRFEWGFPKPIKIIQELRPWQKNIENIVLSEPDDRTIYWFWEDIGNIGKSALVKYLVVKYNCLFCQGGKESDLMNLVFNNDMDNCKCVIFDIPRAHQGHISYSALENIKNGLVCNTKYETGFKAFNSVHVICFANYLPAKPEMLSKDRWKIEYLGDEDKIEEIDDNKYN